MIGHVVLTIAFIIGATLWARSIIGSSQEQWKLDGREFHHRQLFLSQSGVREIKNITILYEGFVAFGDILKTDLLIHYCNHSKTQCGRKELTSLLFFDFQKPRNETLTKVEFVSMDLQTLNWLEIHKPTLPPLNGRPNSVSCFISTSNNLERRVSYCEYSTFFLYSSDWNDYYNITSLSTKE